MPAAWKFDTDPAKKLLRIRLSGTFSVADVEQMDLERKGAIGTLRCRFNDHRVLIDVSRCDLSTPDVAEALQAAIGNPVFRAGKCAMVVASALIRMQARRVVNRPDMRFCTSVEEAEAWLIGDCAAAA
ncbi:MAG: STAS/SEC14 domain-containing protein [Sphingomonas sp.]|nr:STAS/SEC14 domain-containing protein [Sphingomonas sp.]